MLHFGGSLFSWFSDITFAFLHHCCCTGTHFPYEKAVDGNFTGDGLLAGSKVPSNVEEHEDSIVLTPPSPQSDSEDDGQMRKRLLSEFH